MDFRIRLRDEYAQRVARNPRYSLRAFARALALHHSTLVRLLDGSRGFSQPLLRRLGVRLGLTAGEVQGAITAENARRVLAATRSPDFRPDCRWIAMKSGMPR